MRLFAEELGKLDYTECMLEEKLRENVLWLVVRAEIKERIRYQS